jgi:hypothetical protein
LSGEIPKSASYPVADRFNPSRHAAFSSLSNFLSTDGNYGRRLRQRRSNY